MENGKDSIFIATTQVSVRLHCLFSTEDQAELCVTITRLTPENVQILFADSIDRQRLEKRSY